MVSIVPKDIREALNKAAKYREKAHTYEVIIEEWLESLGVDEDDSFRDTYIDLIQQPPFDSKSAIERMNQLLPRRSED
ncbi:hypothetical protein DN757_01625 [Paenibacillus silvae]|uniref:Uncharacterized protein n=1 Tax=Paenibacillus silvae TaxID=1325358 RepID=A0A2W6QJP6_9BACL|nr:hypothetical protein DN757_01625 [Paenibacillus silvae]